MRLLAGAVEKGELELRYCGKRKSTLRFAEHCNTGDIDRRFNVLNARIVEAEMSLLVEE